MLMIHHWYNSWWTTNNQQPNWDAISVMHWWQGIRAIEQCAGHTIATVRMMNSNSTVFPPTHSHGRAWQRIYYESPSHNFYCCPLDRLIGIAIEIKWGCHENWSAITQSKITMAGDTLYAKEYSTIICRTSLIRRQLTTGNNHHNLSNNSTNYATVLIATNLKLKDLRRCHHSGLTPPTTNRRMYRPQTSYVPKMQIECQLTRASHSALNALLYNSTH